MSEDDSMTRNKTHLFVKEKPTKALITIRRLKNDEDAYAQNISRKINTTYAHTVKTMSKLEDMGFAESQRIGRKKVYRLTEEGKKKAELLDRIFEDDIETTGSALA